MRRRSSLQLFKHDIADKRIATWARAALPVDIELVRGFDKTLVVNLARLFFAIARRQTIENVVDGC